MRSYDRLDCLFAIALRTEISMDFLYDMLNGVDMDDMLSVAGLGETQPWAEEKAPQLRILADEMSISIERVCYAFGGLSLQALKIAVGNVSSMPKNMKSKDNPYVSRSLTAPLSESRCEPLSQFA